MSSLDAAVSEVHKVVKKQKTSEAKVDKSLQDLIDLVTEARNSLSDASTCPEQVLQELGKRIEAAGPIDSAVSYTKELHSAIGKLGKALDKAKEQGMDIQLDVCKAMRDVPMDEGPLNQVIAEHFFREGRFEVGQIFASECGLQAADELRKPYVAMHSILQQIKAKNLQPALDWVAEQRELLSPGGLPSMFEFKLQALNFVNLLKEQGRGAALSYAKQHFQRYQGRFMSAIQRLMGCMLYYGKPLADSEYKDLLSPAAWDEVAADFTRQACSLMGQACESPLAVSVAAGAAALPPLFKLATVMEQKMQGDLRTCEQLPMELELGDEFVFHSIFACPVSRDQSTPDNPPMLLPCNHVLCEQSVLKIAKNRTRVFKCPYCPVEARADNLRALIFPDVE